MPKSTSNPYIERRESKRVEVELGAEAYVANSNQSVKCTVRDISKGGAKLELSDVDIIPTRLKMYVPEVDFIFMCEVAWREKNFVGVKFLNAEAA